MQRELDKGQGKKREKVKKNISQYNILFRGKKKKEWFDSIDNGQKKKKNRYT
jgi:hypothetical protein